MDPVSPAEAHWSYLSVLACPSCHTPLLRENLQLRCQPCERTYTRTESVLSLFTPEGERAMAGSHDAPWSRWRAAIEGLETWRKRQRRAPRLSSSSPADVHEDGTSDLALERLLAACTEGIDRPLIVDVGAKDGRMAARFSRPVRYLGVEPFVQGVHSEDSPVVRALGESLPLQNGTVHGVLCHAVFDYFVDGARALDEMARVLAPGASLALVVSVLTPHVAHARASHTRAGRLWHALSATREVGVRAAATLLPQALSLTTAHTQFYTRNEVMALLAARFELCSVHEQPTRTSSVLYIHARKRTKKRLPVI
ncbi:MAG: methyltransferase domain-containing protein [Deltaproteobacteria bacterium]|nr:methyltransferase domain-containing protein [Deltaproteobacteria bacterium]